MGFVTELKDVVSFIYKATFDNGLTEHEFDHVLLGTYNKNPSINIDEVNNFKWMTLEQVKVDMELNPDIYTEWFKIIFDKFYKHLQEELV